MKIATHFGAGNIGRAFIGEVLQKNNFHINFVDTNADVINKLNLADHYTIHHLNDAKTKVEVRNFSGILSNNVDEVVESLLKSDVVTISIGANNLKFLSKTFIKFINQREINNDTKQVNIICAENGIRVSSTFKELLLNENKDLNLKNIAFVDAAVDKIVPEQHNENIDVYGEEFYEFALDINQWIGEKLVGVDYYKDLSPVLERKLFMLNGTHSYISWLGFGVYKLVYDFADYEDIKKLVIEYMEAISQVISKKFDWDIEEIRAYAKKTLKRFENRNLVDNIERTGRNVMRKVRNDERIVSPLLFAYTHGLDYKPSIKALIAAYVDKDFEDEEYKEIKAFKRDNGLEAAIRKYSGINDDKLIAEIISSK